MMIALSDFLLLWNPDQGEVCGVRCEGLDQKGCTGCPVSVESLFFWLYDHTLHTRTGYKGDNHVVVDTMLYIHTVQ